MNSKNTSRLAYCDERKLIQEVESSRRYCERRIMTHTSAVRMPALSTIKDFLECPICLQIYTNPHKVQCGHRFCEICLYSMVRKAERVCPLDGKRITPENAILDMELQSKLESVRAECPQSKKGCDWRGQVAEIEAHKRMCMFVEVNCPKGCGRRLMKKDVKSHAQESCMSSFTRCRKCYVEMTMEQFQNHQCPCDKYECPEECGKKEMTLQELRYHKDARNGQCNAAQMPCRFNEAGCTFKGKKNELDAHMKAKSEEHMTILSHSLSKMTFQQKEAEEKIKKQGEQLKTIQETFCQYAILLKQFETKQQDLLNHSSEQDVRIKDQQKQIASKDSIISELKLQLEDCHAAIDELQNGSQNGTLLWRISDFKDKLNRALSLKNFSEYSPVIYTSKFGYKLCAQLFPAGSGDASGRYMSIYFHLMPTEHDDVLRWPFSNKIAFTLIDQAENTEEANNVSYTIVPAPNAPNYQKPSQKMSEGRGCHQFIALQELESRNYVKNDQIFIKIKVLQRN